MKTKNLIKGLTFLYYYSYLHADLMINMCSIQLILFNELFSSLSHTKNIFNESTII